MRDWYLYLAWTVILGNLITASCQGYEDFQPYPMENNLDLMWWERRLITTSQGRVRWWPLLLPIAGAVGLYLYG